MTQRKIITTLKSFQKAPAKGKMRRGYFAMFEKKMAYRTTKGEHPQMTANTVNRVFEKISAKRHD
ncbi:MAG: hypothetical protein WCG84_00790 [Candidatus Moraniibacteriota bacterium]